jgi:endonuclease YncB( thermonuclease family)
MSYGPRLVRAFALYLASCGVVEDDAYVAPVRVTPSAAGCLATGYGVSEVFDGDTIAVTVGADSESIRVKGVLSPEIAHATGEVSAPCGDEALQYTRTTVGTRVDLQFDADCAADPFNTCARTHGRLVAYVRLADCSDLGLRLLERGLATVYWEPFERRASYEAAEGRARAALLGVHGGPCSAGQ